MLKKAKMLVTKLMLLSCATVFSSFVLADVTLTYAGAKEITKFHIANGKLSIEVGGEAGDGGMFYDQKTDPLYAIQHSEKQYIEMEKMVEQMSGMKSQMQQMFDEQMAGMSEAEKAQMKAMMGNALGGLLGNDDESEEQTKTQFTLYRRKRENGRI